MFLWEPAVVETGHTTTRTVKPWMEFAKRSSTGHVKMLGFGFLLHSLYNNLFHHFIISAWKASCVCKSGSVQMERTHVGAMPDLETELGIVFSTAQSYVGLLTLSTLRSSWVKACCLITSLFFYSRHCECCPSYNLQGNSETGILQCHYHIYSFF